MLIALAEIKVGDARCRPGDVLANNEGRNFSYDVSRGTVLEVPPVALPTVLAAGLALDDEGEATGSRIQPRAVALGGKSVGQAKLVAAARARAGLSVVGWNALPESAREMLIHAEADLWGEAEIPPLEAGAGTPEKSGPGEKPDAPHVLFDPNIHALKHQGKYVGHTIVEAESGELVARVSKATNERLKKARKDNRRVYAEIIEDGGGR